MAIPLVFWGQSPPTHEITCICRSEDKKGFATASKSGQICLWDIYRERETEKLKVRPRCLMFGHSSEAISLCFVRNHTGERDMVASLSRKGTICLWDGKEGSCLRYVNIPGHHTGIKALSRQKYGESLIALYGMYSCIYILDSTTLEVICTLKAAHNPNWNAQICFISNVERRDALLSLTVAGVAKHWLLPSRSEMKETGELYEETSKTLDFNNPLSVSSCTHHTHCTMLVVRRDAWQLYDVTGGKMKLLMIHACEPSVDAWKEGEYLDYRNIIVWSKNDGRGFVYKLSPRCVPGIEKELEESISSTTTAGCHVAFILGCPAPTGGFPLASYLDKYWQIQGDKEGRVYLWDIRRIRDEITESQSDDPIPPDTDSCIANSWGPPAMPCGLTDMLYPPDTAPPPISCGTYLSSFGRLVCGQDDGCILVLSAIQAATVLMLQPKKFSRGWPQYCRMSGHKGRVNCLLHPGSHSKAYNVDHLLSGGSDFTVRLWDLYSGNLVHTFAVHGGGVKSILSCPADINPRLQTCVCSIAEDYSVAILSTSERKCLLVAASHSSPVESVRFRLEEDFLLVSCTNGRLYVWQIETGSLDRSVEGETAQIILNSSTDTSRLSQTAHSSDMALQVRSLRASPGDSMIQVLLFEPTLLINRLAKMEKLEEMKPKVKEPKKQVDAFKTYVSARRHYGSGVGRPPTSSARAPARRGSTDPLARSYSLVGVAPSEIAPPSDPRAQERAREALGMVVASQTKSEQLTREAPGTIINIVRILLSCLHAWNLDESLDKSCEDVLGLIRPARPVSFGFYSKGCLSLVLPGWGLKSRPKLDSQMSADLDGPVRGRTESLGETFNNIAPSTTPQDGGMAYPSAMADGGEVRTDPQSKLKRGNSVSVGFTFDQKYHIRWQFSQSLTTQHLLTMVSLTNTLMNQSVGAHALASNVRRKKNTSESSLDEDSDSDSEESHTTKDNLIRAYWSQVAALHCVMLPERMQGKFRPPHLPVLASRFLDPCQAIREASQALLQAELKRIGSAGRKELVTFWASKLQSLTGLKSAAEKMKRGSEAGDILSLEAVGPVPSHAQQCTALIILGMIGAEFHSSSSQARKKSVDIKGGHRSVSDLETLDPAIARQTAKTLQAVLLESPSSKSPLHSNLRCSAAELIGRGFNLWEKYVDIPQVVMGLLDLVIQYSPIAVGKEEKAKKSSAKSLKFVSEVAHKALNLMVILRPITMVTTLAKEIALFLASQHVTHFPHSSLPPVQVGVTPPPSTAGIVTPPTTLLPLAKGEVLELLRVVMEKCSHQLQLQLLEVVDIVLFCLDPDQLKKRNFLELFPAFAKMSNISYSPKTKRLAVGARSGQVGLYDLKQGRTQMMNAHSHAVTVLMFSEDGKLLATYAYGDSTLSMWQIGTSLFGINQTPRFVNSWPAISSSSASSYINYVRLEWSGSRSIILHMPGGVECKYSL